MGLLNSRLNSGFYGASSFGPSYSCSNAVCVQDFSNGVVVQAEQPQVPVEPNVTYSPSPEAQAGSVAHLMIKLPSPDAKLWIDDYQSRQNGMQRTMVTPSLEPGAKYAYTLIAMWTEDGEAVTRSRDVTFQAGQSVVIDFTVPQPRRVDPEN